MNDAMPTAAAEPVTWKMYVFSAAPKMNHDAFEIRFAEKKVTNGG